MPPGIQAPGADFTAYLKWDGFAHGQPLVLEEDEETPAGKVIEAAKTKLREHMALSMRLREKETIEKRQREGVYPYAADPKSESEKTARSAFNVVAQAFSRTVEASKSTDLKKMALGLCGVVLREDGRDGIPDLVLGRKMRIAKNSYEQLVVELKRPGHTLEDKDVMQIRSYASAIKNDPRFDQQNVSWEFWLIGTDMKTR